MLSVLPWTALAIASEALAVYLLMPSRIVSGAISNDTESDPEEVEEEEGEEVEPEVEDWGLEFGCSEAEGDGICLTVVFRAGLWLRCTACETFPSNAHVPFIWL